MVKNKGIEDFGAEMKDQKKMVKRRRLRTMWRREGSLEFFSKEKKAQKKKNNGKRRLRRIRKGEEGLEEKNSEKRRLRRIWRG